MQDSSELIDSLISEHQRSLLDITYYGDKANRDKYTIIMAEAIDPKMVARWVAPSCLPRSLTARRSRLCVASANTWTRRSTRTS